MITVYQAEVDSLFTNTEAFQKYLFYKKKLLDFITEYDVYKAVDSVHDEGLFHFHDNPNPECPIGRNIHKAMDSKLERVQQCMEDEMRQITLADVMTDIQSELKKN